MRSIQDRCWLKHWKRELWNSCPLCGKSLTWVRVADWTPCDEEPVLYVPGGKLTIVKKRDYVENCALYKKGDGSDVRPETGLIPHYYTCEVLLKERKDWARDRERVRAKYGNDSM